MHVITTGATTVSSLSVHFAKVHSFLFVPVDRFHAEIYTFCDLCVCFYLNISYNKERENASCYGGFLSFLPKT